MAQPLQISWNNFSWWLADQKYQAPQWRYFKWYWFNTTWYDVRPTSSPGLVHTYTETINAIFNTQKVNWSNNNIIWLNNGQIYENTTLRATIAGTSKQGYNIGYMKPFWETNYKLYYFHYTIPVIWVKNIHRSNLNWWGFQENYRSFTSTDWNPFIVPPINPNRMLIKNEWDRILFTYFNELWQIDATEVVSKILSFPSEQNIVWLTEFQWEYKIYTTAWFASSRIYLWGWTDVDEAPKLNVDLKWLAITWWVQWLWAYDYMVADWNFYQVAWVQYQELYHRLGWNIVLAYDDRIVYELEQNGKRVLAEYFNKPWYAKWIHPINIININSQGTWISAIEYNENWLVFASFSKLYSDVWVRETWNIDCFLESMVFQWTNIQYEKTITEIILKFSLFTTNLLKLYVQVNENNTWIKVWEWTNNSISTQNHWLKIPKHQFLNPVWNFNTIRFKLEAPHTWNRQWIIYWLDLIGNENIWK
jgi:hypothetical protein